MKKEDRTRRTEILIQLVPPETMFVLTALAVVEEAILRRKKEMSEMIDAMSNPPSKKHGDIWFNELMVLLKDYSLLSKMVTEVFESLTPTTTTTTQELELIFSGNKTTKSECHYEDVEAMKELERKGYMLVPGPKGLQ